MKDISNKVILVLVTLIVVISIFSTVLLLGNIGSRTLSRSQIESNRDSSKISEPVIKQIGNSINGKVSFRIENP
jgi:CHASE3 domain sensor protein